MTSAVHNLEENCQCQSPDEGAQAHPELLSGVRVSRDLESWGAVLGSPHTAFLIWEFVALKWTRDNGRQ